MRWATGTDGGAGAAGNLTFDGRHKYTYDAWNRMRSVGHAQRDSNGTVQIAVNGQIGDANQWPVDKPFQPEGLAAISPGQRPGNPGVRLT